MRENPLIMKRRCTNKLHPLLLFVISLLLSLSTHAQTPEGWQELYARMGNAEEMESGAWQETCELLADLQAHPINLNTASREDLERLPFLTEKQIEDLCDYLYHYAPMKTLAELALIESIDTDTRLLLQYFVYLGEEKRDRFPSLKNLLKYGRHEVVAALSLPIISTQNEKKKFLGYDCRHFLRYDFHLGQRLRVGFLAAQDAGEPFFANRNRMGYDNYAFYFLLRQLGPIRSLAVGRYRLRFGMGLVIDNGYSLGKLPMLVSLGRTVSSLHAHSSRSEGQFLQGAAATLQLFPGADFTAFVSFRKIDATLTADSTGIRTINRTGYHRTRHELSRKHNAEERVFGGHLGFSRNGFHAGFTALGTTFDQPLRPDSAQIYRRNAPTGRSFHHLSLDYGYIRRRFSITGETAMSAHQALATLNQLSWQCTERLSLLLLQRFYSYRYHAFFARSFSDGGQVNNESGLYIGFNWKPLPAIALSAYTDYAYFAFPRPRCSASSHSWDHLFSAVYSRGRLSLQARYRLRSRQEDAERKSPKTAHQITQVNKTEHRARMAFVYTLPQWFGKVQTDFSCTRKGQTNFGWMLSASGGWQNAWLRLDAMAGYFHTDNFTTRIYLYERSPRYSFYFPSFFGKGLRCTLIARANIGKHLQFTAKLGTTHRAHPQQASTSPSAITGKTKMDASVQLVGKF